MVGNTGTGPGGQSQQTLFSTAWDGDKVVIDIRYSGRPVDVGAESEHKEVWSLDSQGALVTTVTDRNPGTEPTTTNLTYRRRPSIDLHHGLPGQTGQSATRIDESPFNNINTAQAR